MHPRKSIVTLKPYQGLKSLQNTPKPTPKPYQTTPMLYDLFDSFRGSLGLQKAFKRLLKIRSKARPLKGLQNASKMSLKAFQRPLKSFKRPCKGPLKKTLKSL
jgi:hypothetical protein